ncbi:transcriptional regulator, PadR family [Streptoalloteichus tenebrarius]|uniref:Transcriptional regulator, PadR family n=1 Tax=Streptoalloteichus tenebrarius (strain ATCC 17920 / DSM 40477 / JCM 4838 / CBS 697.72 / NBRC 16177 / NCIMB 11028 / NRRL B-12390 / A12253. 1 / ISP 5477) TaxID=1933 RepID=A0ABT1I438_STRSD|nr:PadR family transcriptional regulator [Streptoalloteichus tenebrarius]MCP2262552.1 transcriptional regulator, PadR family [Streptoalloteichus tenebrarius]BFE98650.1 PadR family transcriptional regulator [Streptoalloteichus tenebrarius]
MTAVRLLVLGAVRRRGRAHGYQVRADLESWGAHEWSSATSGSVYHALKAMTGQGLLVLHETTPSEAGGPPRMEYELTEEGERTYLALLRSALSSRDPRLDLLAAAVGFLDDLPRAEAVDLLRRRARAMDEWRRSITTHLPPDANLDEWGPVGEVVSLWLHTAESRAEWTHRLIRRLEAGAFRMAGEDDADCVDDADGEN